MDNVRDFIAKNIALMLHDGDFVNLGIGIPTLVANHIPEGVQVILHGENGFAGQGKVLPITGIHKDEETYRAWLREHGGEQTDHRSEEGHRDLINAGGFYITLLPIASCFDSSISFAMARGGHLDATVLGGLQVDRNGNLANWMVPGKKINGMGGAMDLACGAKRVIVAMEHCARDGRPKILEECEMPLTAIECVDTVVTEKCIITIEDKKLIVTAMAPGITREELQAVTGAKLDFAPRVGLMEGV